MTTIISPGIRNNNPGNIRKSSDKWIGLSDNQTHSDFFIFDSPIYGIRALARLLITYQNKYNLSTVRGIISRWSPHEGQDSSGTPYKNPTEEYIKYVSKKMGISDVSPINVYDYDTLKILVKSMIFFENSSMPYKDSQIDQALLKAGVQNASSTSIITTDKQERRRDTLQKVGIGSLSLGAVAEATTHFSEIQNNLLQIKFGIIILLFVALGSSVYLYYDEIRTYIKAKFDL